MDKKNILKLPEKSILHREMGFKKIGTVVTKYGGVILLSCCL